MPTLSFLLRPFLTGVIALRALGRNKLRSSLTALGIIIGVASVIVMVAVGNGAQARIEARVASLGQDLLIIFAGNRHSSGVNGGTGSASNLTIGDAAAIAREIPDVVAISPEVSTIEQAIANGRNWSTTIAGESPDYLKIRDWALSAGAMFGERDVRAAAKTAVIGSLTANKLFGPINPIGQIVRVKNIPFVIIGILASKGAGMGDMDQDDRILVPYTTAMKRITGEKRLRSISLQVSSTDRMAVAQAQITDLLRQRHRVPTVRENDFHIMNQQEIADIAGSITRIITLLLGSIAGLSLVVGGIGIMNIMLVSVTERTREVGIRVAIGAQAGDILLQFLIEAVTLSLLGGFIGVLVGIGASKLTAIFTGFDAIVSGGSVVLAFAVSAAIGIFFGFYPARKAALLDPIEALRYE